jgi:hypothetical protein
MAAEDVVPQDKGAGTEKIGGSDSQTEDPNESPLGVYAPFPYSPEPFADLSEEARGALLGLDKIATQTDTYARRMEVEQAWEALHFERGYQHLLRSKRGGWVLPNQGSEWGASGQKTSSTTYDTNVYGPKGDIIVAALSREVPKVEFFPANPDYGPDQIAAEEADRFKDIWARNNNLHAVLVDCSRMFWNEGRVLMWTRYELNGQKYGFEGDVKAPTVPEDILNPPDGTPTGQTELDDVLGLETSKEDSSDSGIKGIEDLLNAAGSESEDKRPLGREVTTIHGKLDHKVPIAIDDFHDFPFVQLSLDVDVATARGMFPWIASKINPGTDGMSETQLDRIARENVRQAVLGAYVTGDSLERHTTVKFTWFRPSMFLDQSVSDEAKAELLEAFPNGALLARAGAEFAFARNEGMDDHLVVGHPLPGKGQNRRTLGSALISIQKRINDWVDLLDDFFKRTVPKKWMNSEAFDMEAVKNEPNVPGTTGPFQVQPGLTTMDQYIFVEPTPQPQPSMFEAIKYFMTTVAEDISGALPSLFGAATGEQTVGNPQIQRDQALQRIGCPWNNIQDMFAEAARQAVQCAAECRDGKEIKQNIPGRGNLTVNTANLLAGKVLCYAESNPAFPESWQQKEAKIENMISMSASNPLLNSWFLSPSNLAEVASGLRMKKFKVVGATSVTKQRNEFELLLRRGPIDNPQFLNTQAALQKAQAGAQQAQVTGQQVPPEAQAMMLQAQQAVQTMPPQISTVQVAQDESENHIVEANECFEWMNDTDGQKFKNGTPEQQAGYANVHLHWQAHVAMAKKIMAQNKPPDKPPSESVSADVSKMPPEVATQLLAKMGVQATPALFQQQQDTALQHKVAGKAIPEALAKSNNEPEKQPPPQAPPQ